MKVLVSVLPNDLSSTRVLKRPLHHAISRALTGNLLNIFIIRGGNLETWVSNKPKVILGRKVRLKVFFVANDIPTTGHKIYLRMKADQSVV